MLQCLVIKCPLILSGLRDMNKWVPTGTQTSTPAPGCRGGHVDVTASQLQALQPTWKEAILIFKAATDPCLLPLPHFALAEQPTCRNPSGLRQLLQPAQTPWT